MLRFSVFMLLPLGLAASLITCPEKCPRNSTCCETENGYECCPVPKESDIKENKTLSSLLRNRASAFRCYSCTAKMWDTQCNQKVENCKDKCMTMVTHFVGIQLTTKTCTTDKICNLASKTNINTRIAGNKVTCCNTDLCNMNGCAIAGLHVVLLGLPAVLLLLLSGTS